MSWVEEQDWFGLEDLVLEAYYSNDMDSQVEYIPAWRMANGDLIAIEDMSTSHIKNCIKMIYKENGTWRREYLRLFENELRRRKFSKYIE